MRRTQGRVYRHHGTWYCDYSVNGERFRHALKDRDGQPVASASQAREELDRLTRPYTAKTEKDRRQLAADALRTSAEVAVSAEVAARPRRPIAEAWERYPYTRSRRGAVERELSPTSITDNRQLWARFERWAKDHSITNLEDVTVERAVAYRESLIAEKLSGHRVNLAVLVARAVFGLAGIEPNPFAGLKRRANTRKGHRELTVQELTKICQSAKGELRTLLAIGLYTGLRLGDACRLAWEDIALDLSTITMLPGKTAYRGQSLGIPIHPELRAILGEIPRGEGPVMPVVADRYKRQKTLVAQMLRRHFKKAKITTTEDAPDRQRRASVVGFHSLRHTFVSAQARAGVPEHVVRELVGHTSPMVHAIYQHTNGEDKRRAIMALPEVSADSSEVRDRQEVARLAFALPIEAVRAMLAAGGKGGEA